MSMSYTRKRMFDRKPASERLSLAGCLINLHEPLLIADWAHDIGALLACDFCRHRKRKCDGARPKCSTCIESNADCLYKELPFDR
jgi:hypothetical protein